MSVLPDYLAHDLSIVFCGTAVASMSAARGHYYSRPRNKFWQFLYEPGLTPIRIDPEDDKRIVEFGLGLTDLAKGVVANSDGEIAKDAYDVPGFLAKMQKFRPAWVAFHGKRAAEEVANHLKMLQQLQLGQQSWKVGTSSVFVLPSASSSKPKPEVMAWKGRPIGVVQGTVPCGKGCQIDCEITDGNSFVRQCSIAQKWWGKLMTAKFPA